MRVASMGKVRQHNAIAKVALSPFEARAPGRVSRRGPINRTDTNIGYRSYKISSLNVLSLPPRDLCGSSAYVRGRRSRCDQCAQLAIAER